MSSFDEFVEGSGLVDINQEPENIYAEVRMLYETVLTDSSPRIQAAAQRRAHYNTTTNAVPGSTQSDLQGGRHDLRIPWAHTSTVGLLGRLVGEMPQTHCVPRQATDEEQWRAEAREKVLGGCYAASRAPAQFQSAGWHGSVLGAGVWKMWWDFEKNLARFRSVRPENVLVRFSSGDSDEWEYVIFSVERDLKAVARRYGVRASELTADRIEDGTMRGYVQVLDYWDKGVHVLCAGGRVLESGPNIYKFIPYILVKNWGPTEYAWGLSDQAFYEGLAEYNNQLVSQHADVIRLYANPAVFGRQTGMNASQLLSIVREGGAIATNKENAAVEFVQAGGSPPAFESQANRVQDLIAQASFSRDTLGSMSAGLSGTALAGLAEPRELLTALKRTWWEESQKELNRRLLQMVERLGSGRMVFSGELSSGLRSRSFYLELNDQEVIPSEDELLAMASADPELSRLPQEMALEVLAGRDMNFRTVIDGCYETRVIWPMRTAKYDPQFQLMLLNRFAQGAMSLRSFLEEVGVEDVDRELRRLEQEYKEMPWLRPQQAQLAQQMMEGMQGGQTRPGLGMAGQMQGDMFDVLSRAMNGSEGTSRQGGAVQGAPYGGA